MVVEECRYLATYCTRIHVHIFTRLCFITGHVIAACTKLQIKLGRPLLWAARRKLIGGTFLWQIWNDLNEEISKNPEIAIFKRFRDTGFAAILLDLPLRTCIVDEKFLMK